MRCGNICRKRSVVARMAPQGILTAWRTLVCSSSWWPGWSPRRMPRGPCAYQPPGCPFLWLETTWMGMSLPAAPKARFWRGLFVPILIGLGNKWRLLTSCNWKANIPVSWGNYLQQTLPLYSEGPTPFRLPNTHCRCQTGMFLVYNDISTHKTSWCHVQPPITFDLCSNLWHLMILPMDDPRRSSKLRPEIRCFGHGFRSFPAQNQPGQPSSPWF